MSRKLKMLIGLAATLLMGWLWHGPLGRGEAFVAGLESQAHGWLVRIDIPGVQVHFSRDPLTRTATMSGPADDLQREGLGSEWGLNDYMRSIPGVAGVRWTDNPKAGRSTPLLLETLGMLTLAYALGLGLGALIFGRRKRQSFLD